MKPFPKLALSLVSLTILPGCLSPLARIDELPDGRALGVSLDANAQTTFPGRRLKFFVDIVNNTNSRVELNHLWIRLNVSPEREPETVSLTKRWNFEWRRDVTLDPTKRVTIPIAQKITGFQTGTAKGSRPGDRQRLYASDFPIEQLRPGSYEVRATVNDRYTSPPVPLKVIPSPSQNNPRVPTATWERSSRTTDVDGGDEGS